MWEGGSGSGLEVEEGVFKLPKGFLLRMRQDKQKYLEGVSWVEKLKGLMSATSRFQGAADQHAHCNSREPVDLPDKLESWLWAPAMPRAAGQIPRAPLG